MKIKHILLVIFIVVFSSNMLFSQDKEFYFDDEKTSNPPKKEKTFIREKILFGGHFSLAFGTYTKVEISPEAIYKVHDMIHVGLGINSTYYHEFSYNNTAIVYGGRAFVRVFPIEQFYLQGEYELLNILQKDRYSGYSQTHSNIEGILVGVGYRQKIGENASFMTTILLNVSMNEHTPYVSPLIYRLGFTF